MLSNDDCAKCFANGNTSGKSDRMTIEGNRLYSYAACIAIRLEEPKVTPDGESYRFILSNRTSYLGGAACSNTTSRHLSVAYYYCKPSMLVNGWAEEDKPEWIIPHLPTHKTVRGLLRGFLIGHRGWVGSWDGKEAHKDIEIRNDSLYVKDMKIATRYYITNNVKGCEQCQIRLRVCPNVNRCLSRFPVTTWK